MTHHRDSVLVTGASCQIGHFLLPQLISSGFTVHALSRKPPTEEEPPIQWHRIDLESDAPIELEVDGVIHLAPLPLLPHFLSRLTSTKIRRLIAFGSTSRYTKADSADPSEKEFAQNLEDAEARIAGFCQQRSVAWTVLRPTLIYGCGKDKNVTAIARLVRRFRFFPLLGDDGGLRQPVHAEDLASACLQAWNNAATYNRCYNLSGGEVLRYRTMVERIFHAEGVTPRFLTIPPELFRLAVSALSLLPGFRHLSTEMVNRITADLSFDHSEARRDFGFSPRGFQPKSDI
jgi:nucleoside-diphosphate-sugar epimerase